MPLSQLSRDTLRGLRKHTIGYSVAQAKIVAATANTPTNGVPFVNIADRFELAQLSYDDTSFDEIIEILTKRLRDGSKWRRVLKALIILKYCLEEGSERFEEYCRTNLAMLESLERFEYVLEDEKDRGIEVRRAARSLLGLLNDPVNLGQIRQHSRIVRCTSLKEDGAKGTRRYNTIFRRRKQEAPSSAVIIDRYNVDYAQPVTVCQRVRRAVSNGSSWQATVRDFEVLTDREWTAEEFIDVVAALLETLVAAQAEANWAQVFKCLFLLRDCLPKAPSEITRHLEGNNEVGELLREFRRVTSDIPRHSSARTMFEYSSGMDSSAFPAEKGGNIPENVAVPAQISETELFGIGIEHSQNQTEMGVPPSYLASIHGVDVLGNPEMNSPSLNFNQHPSTDTSLMRPLSYRPLPLLPTVWSRLHTGMDGEMCLPFVSFSRRNPSSIQYNTQQLYAPTVRPLPPIPVASRTEAAIEEECFVNVFAHPMEDDEEYFYETDDDDISIIGYEGEPVVRGVPSPFIVQTIESSNDWLHDALAAIHEVEIATEELLYRSKLLTAARETRDYEESVAASERFVVPWSDEGVYHVPELDLDNSDSEESEDEDNDHVAILATPPSISAQIIQEDELSNATYPKITFPDLPLPSGPSYPTFGEQFVPSRNPLRLEIPKTRSRSNSQIDAGGASPLTLLEPGLNLTGKVERVGDYPFALGGFSDVWRGTCHDDGNSENVAIKLLRAVKMTKCDSAGERMIVRMRREMNVWERLDHPHVAPLRGFIMDHDGTPGLVSPWYSEGNVLNYLKNNPFADRRKLVRDVADGLAYLHGQTPSIVHADIKGQNVLVDAGGNASLADFGLSKILQDCPSSYTTSNTNLGTLRWCSPELFTQSVPSTTLESDVWAFAALSLEILTGKVPFYYYANDVHVIRAVSSGETPSREQYPELPKDNKFWNILEACWQLNPADRPTMTELLPHILDDANFAQET